MMWFTLIFASLAAVFGATVWQWLRMNPVPPLSPIPDYRPVVRHQTYATPVFATSAYSMLTATSGVVWPVENPVDVSFLQRVVG